MTTTFSLSTPEYDLAKAYAEEQNLTMDEIDNRIDEGEAQFDRGEFITHEQMMDDLKKEFSWLR
ncbi:MAG: hypothetical protein J6O54_02320 [Prevotella sp.]|nr:hypothetical protein [Prevotella sp.]